MELVKAKQYLEQFKNKRIDQFINIFGDGQLLDNSTAVIEFRKYLEICNNVQLEQYANECIDRKFEGNGYVLQDIVNEIGKRLGFKVEHGVYRGSSNKSINGFDGLWKSPDGYEFVIETKTTSDFQMSLKTFIDYRKKLIFDQKIGEDTSSIVLVIGRGKSKEDLEAQIRGSRFGWFIRTISVEALIQMLAIRENTNDINSFNKIYQIFRPEEYTRLDKLVDLLFTTSKDANLDDEADEEDVEEKELTPVEREKKFTPVKFYQGCIERIQKHMDVNLRKSLRITWIDDEKDIHVKCSISKLHDKLSYSQYWFAFHPHQREYLRSYENSYMAFGCGTPDRIVLFPFADFDELVDNMNITEREDRHYWHVHIQERNGQYFILQSKSDTSEPVDITKYVI
ncbi:MAG: hypothetical protein AAFY76_05055 [Cyanobacteria bacterium J06649_11]